MCTILQPAKLKLRDYQVTGVKHLLSGRNRLLLDDPGLGKTAQAIVAFNSVKAKKVLVVCPSSVRFQWADEVHRWSASPYRSQVITKGHTWLNDKAHVYITSYDLIVSSPMLFAQFKAMSIPVMILDEVHYCKSGKAKRTKRILGRGGLFDNAVYTWGLSGTPMTNTPIDLYPVMRTIGNQQLGPFADWMKYTKRYCQRFKSKWGWDVSGASNLEELNTKLFKYGLAKRRDKKEVLAELPERQYRLVRLEPDKKALGEPVLWDHQLKQKDWSGSINGIPGDELAELRHDMALAKVDMVLKYVGEQDSKKIVIFCWHRDIVETLSEQLGNACMYYGGLTSQAKELEKHKFINDDNIKYLVCNIASAGTGVDGLQHVCSHAIFAEIPWTYTELMQATDRLWRMGQKSHVTSDILVADNSLEMHIMKTVFKKEKYFSDLLLTRKNT